ncbi:MAG: DUF7665 family protein [Methylotenera sp.]
MDNGKNSLEAHLQSGRFLAGVFKGRWKLLSLEWPIVLIEIKARDERKLTLRFECTGYPEAPPTATLWDIAQKQQLATKDWPRGGRVSQVFNPNWLGGAALYIPCDRQAIVGHTNWVSELPWLIWKPQLGLIQYMEAVYETLQSYELEPQAA